MTASQPAPSTLPRKWRDGRGFYRRVVDQFDVPYEESQRRSGAVLALSVHPFLNGHPFRHKYLDQVLGYIGKHDDVWMTTSDDIADWYLERNYDGAVAAQKEGASVAGGGPGARS